MPIRTLSILVPLSFLVIGCSSAARFQEPHLQIENASSTTGVLRVPRQCHVVSLSGPASFDEAGRLVFGPDAVLTLRILDPEAVALRELRLEMTTVTSVPERREQRHELVVGGELPWHLILTSDDTEVEFETEGASLSVRKLEPVDGG